MTGVIAWVLAGLTSLQPALPPPLCRGRSAGAYDPRRDGAPSPRALAEVQAAYDALCPTRDCGRGVLHANPTAGMNAYTWVSGIEGGAHTKAKIVYSRRFLNGLNQSFGPGASFGVLAHEVGHHLTAARALRKRLEPAWNEELRADWFAGCALGRAGRSLEALENALRALASVATASHPSFRERIPVVRRGFRECSGTARAASRNAFGVGALLGGGRRSDGCWRYLYRLRQEMLRLGPIGPARRRSSGYASKEACEEAREGRDDRESEPCVCSRRRR
jgi:hypothetical protein